MQRAIFVAAVVSGLMISVTPATAQPALDAGVPDTGLPDAAPSNAATPDAVKVDRVPVDVAPVVTAALKGDPVVAVHGPLSVDAGDVSAKPSLSPGRITGEVFGGFGLGIVGVLVGGGVGLITSNHRGDGASDINGIFFGGLVGYVIAVPLGVYLAGRVGDQTCSGTGALVGSILGVVPGLLLAASEPGGSGGNTKGTFDIEVGLVLAGQVAGSVIGCNVGRRYKSPVPKLSVGSLVQLRDGHVALGIPIVVRGRIHDTAVTNVPLFTATF